MRKIAIHLNLNVECFESRLWTRAHATNTNNRALGLARGSKAAEMADHDVGGGGGKRALLREELATSHFLASDHCSFKHALLISDLPWCCHRLSLCSQRMRYSTCRTSSIHSLQASTRLRLHRIFQITEYILYTAR